MPEPTLVVKHKEICVSIQKLTKYDDYAKTCFKGDILFESRAFMPIR